jgi:uncharacterized membrane protein
LGVGGGIEPCPLRSRELGWAVVEWHETFAPYLLTGSALYVVGSMVVTVAFNLPRNDALATVAGTT